MPVCWLCSLQVEEIMQALQQAFHSAFQQSVKNHIVCELCPMHQLHKLCQEIEGKFTQAALTSDSHWSF